jgi:hypothetical protein
MRRITLMLLCGVGLWGCGGYTRYLGPTGHGYSFHARAVPTEIFLPSDLVSQDLFPPTAALQVQVRDENEKPAEGVPVMFQYAGSECQGVLTLSAQRAVTLQGQASITLTSANTSGSCRIAVRVDNVTQELWVAVSSPPDPGMR